MNTSGGGAVTRQAEAEVVPLIKLITMEQLSPEDNNQPTQKVRSIHIKRIKLSKNKKTIKPEQGLSLAFPDGMSEVLKRKVNTMLEAANLREIKSLNSAIALDLE